MAHPTVSPELGESLLFEEELRGGASFAHVLKRGTALRITALEDGANVPATFFNFELPIERYNMADTLKTQHVAHLTAGHCIHSDMGRVLCSITKDSVGWHDPVAAYSTAATTKAKYGTHSYQAFRNDWFTNTRDNFIKEAAKVGLGIRDLQNHINFFSKVEISLDGVMKFIPGNSKAGDYVELRSEMNTLIFLDTNPHPMDPNPVYAPKKVLLTFKRVPAPTADDPCRLSRPENGRAFINSERYFL